MHKLYQEENSQLPTVLPRSRKNRHQSIKNIRQKKVLTPIFLIKYWFKISQRRLSLSIRKLKGKPVNLARGLAIGVFAGCFPFFGLQSLIGVLLATIFRVSKVAAIAGTWISNPLTYIPLYIFNFKVGKFFLGVESINSQDIDFESLSSFMELGSTFAIVILVGSCIVGAIAAFVSYFIGLAVFTRWQQKKYRPRKKRAKITKNPSANLKK